MVLVTAGATDDTMCTQIMFTFLKPKSKRIYLDYASATPVARDVYEAMQPFWQTHFANPSSIHKEGVVARQAISDARTALARSLSVRPTGVVFTASGTESNNLAIFGLIEARRALGVSYSEMEIISSPIEHPSVSAVLTALQQKGVTIHYLPVDNEGKVVLSKLTDLLSNNTVLVTVAYVNSEIGVVQDIATIARVVRAYETKHSVRICVHTDAAQAPLWLSCNLSSLQVDVLSLDAGKCYGPKGVGILAFRHKVALEPYLYGGGQEFGLRSGTENTPLIIGASVALVRAQREYADQAKRVTLLRDYLLEAVLTIPGVTVNGSRTARVANNINISIAGVEAEFAVISLDAEGIAVATKSACSSGTGGGSAVVRAISGDQARAETTLRITLGRETTRQEIDTLLRFLRKHIEKVRSATTLLT
jgi:cysteine desulfurase